MHIDPDLTLADLQSGLENVFAVAGPKILDLEANYPQDMGAPVFTVEGKYTARGWTEWTQGFTYGAAIFQFDATGDEQFLDLGRRHTVGDMAGHVTHFGVHDHGFNNVSTYGNLLRLMNEGRLPENDWEREFYELALRASAAVQVRRWATTAEGGGYISSFNGPQSLFVDTVRTLRVVALAHRLGHVYKGEQDEQRSFLAFLVGHADSTARYNVYYGDGRDRWDVRGRVAHESLFNTNNGVYRCPSTQQGYCPFSTWTRGLSWALLGFAEELEFLATLPDADLADLGGREAVETMMRRAATATADFWIENSASDGMVYWDTGAPDLHRLGNWHDRPAEPGNDWEPVDSSAAAIAVQGLLRLGHYLDGAEAARYRQAGLTLMRTLIDEPYLATDPEHQGLLKHSIYHQPNGWDHVPPGSRQPHGEACMWGDYHLLEAAIYLLHELRGQPYYTFFGPTA